MGSWGDLNGQRCRRACVHLPSLTLNPVSGPTAGNIMHAHSAECREAGASVRFNAKLVDLNTAVPADDAREVEVLASGLPLFHGAQLAVDITLWSALTATGLPRPGAAVVDGVVCMAARADKERKHSELSTATDACWWWSLSRLAVVGVWKLSTSSNGWRWPAPATRHPICNGQLFCPGGAVGLA